MHRSAMVVLVALVLSACSSTPDEPAPSPPPSPTASAEPSPEPDGAAPDVPALAAPPQGDVTLWLDTIGIPVVAAVRTSTQLAQLAGVPDDERAAICRQVATDLDGIAAPQVLTGLAITADAETATLLVGDLQAKGDLLAACVEGGGDLDERIAEVERTHAVAVAWLERLRGGA